MKSLRVPIVCLVVFAFFALASDALAQSAYVANVGAGSVSVIDTATNRAIEVPDGPAIGVGVEPDAIAITPDGRTAYVANFSSKTVSVIDTATNSVRKAIGGVGDANAIAISPDGRRVYVVNEGEVGRGGVSVIDTATDQLLDLPSGGKQIAVGSLPLGIAISPDGKRAYVANLGGGVSVINTVTDEAIEAHPGEARIAVGVHPRAVAIAPDGSRVYVAAEAGVSVIDTATNEAIEVPDGSKQIESGADPSAIAIAPDGKRAYVANFDGDVAVIDTVTDEVIEMPDESKRIKVGTEASAIAISADGKRAYVATRDGVSVIDTATDEAIAVPDGKAIGVGASPDSLAITPDQAPVASLAGPATVHTGEAVGFDASASQDPDGAIASYAFSFGDGQGQTGISPTASHVFTAPGTFTVTVTATDAEGCSTFLFTGQTAYCNSASSAQASQQITVLSSPPPSETPPPPSEIPPASSGTPPALSTTPPALAGTPSAPIGPPPALIDTPPADKKTTGTSLGVRVRCPKSAKPAGCVFTLQAVAKKPTKKRKKAMPESAAAKAKVKAGRSAIVTLHPKAAFVARFAAATKILVKKTVTIKGKRKTLYVRLPVVR